METSCTEDTTRSGSLSPFPEGGTVAESKKLPSSKYKGVVPQPNGRWGAQIYERHKRVWLGTFNAEDEAARAYDIAARRFRGPEAITNFKKPHHGNDVESAFFTSHSKAEIVDMLRKHTYNEEFHQSKRHYLTRSKLLQPSTNGDVFSSKRREELFEKTVTPSDVGRLNRLVIPKQQAEKHFPLANNNNNNDRKGVLLSFEEESGKVWRFRYSYWNSSQSYVLTKGWSRFVKDKGLKAGDVVRFFKSVSGDEKLYIDWKVGRCGSVRLFGVDIFPGCNGNGKRKNEMRVLSFECDSGKKQRVVVGVL